MFLQSKLRLVLFTCYNTVKFDDPYCSFGMMQFIPLQMYLTNPFQQKLQELAAAIHGDDRDLMRGRFAGSGGKPYSALSTFLSRELKDSRMSANDTSYMIEAMIKDGIDPTSTLCSAFGALGIHWKTVKS